MEAFLVVAGGANAGMRFRLDAEQRVSIGRHRSNTIVISDENVSRRHAEIYAQDGRWILRDLDSSNGTYVNESKVREIALEDGVEVRVCGMEWRFTVATDPEPPTPFQRPTSALLHGESLAAEDYARLCRFMADAVDAKDAHATIHSALEVILQATRADGAGFLSLEEHGDAVRGIVVPATASVDATLSRSLTQMVKARRKPIWLGHERPEGLGESVMPFADALCLPIVGSDHLLLGALHAYQRRRPFRERDFLFCEIVGRHLAGCLRLDRFVRQLAEENQRLRRSRPVAERIVGRSAAMQRLRKRIQQVAPGHTTVLIRGENGSGKELVALEVHAQSPRRAGPFVAVNCGAVGGDLMDSRLFGHVKGAFTGAVGDHLGYIRRGDGGTVFLDEVAELPLECQAKLLRALDGYGFTPVGRDEEVYVNVRFVAATNRNLLDEVGKGRFREDLYYRLHGLEVHVPPLRQRIEDLPELAEYFLEGYAHETGRQVRLGDAALAHFQAYAWPGNVRQFHHVLVSAASNAEGGVIGLEHVAPLSSSGSPGVLPTLNLRQLERLAIEEVIKKTGGAVTSMCKELGVVRASVYNKCDRHQIQLPGDRRPPPPQDNHAD